MSIKSIRGIGEIQEDLLQVVCFWHESIGYDSGVDQEAIQLATTATGCGADKRPRVIYRCVPTPGLLPYQLQCCRHLRRVQLDDVVAMSRHERFDGRLGDELAQ